MMRLWILAIALAGVGPAPAAAAGDVAGERPFTHTVRPRHLAEECFTLPAGQTIGYAFESSAPVDFNIHYHVDRDIVYPVKSDQIAKAEDRFTAPSTEEFCLMWTNKAPELVTVRGQLRP